MYIRIKKRNTSSGVKKFAYLVRSRYYKKGPRQKVVKYLGKAYNLKKKITLGKNSSKIISNNLEDFLLKLVIRELKKLKFQEKENLIFCHHEGFKIDLIKKEVKNEFNQDIALSLNYGFLCAYTLKKLFEKSFVIKKPVKIAEDIGKNLISAGVSIKSKEFIAIYDLLEPKAAKSNHE